MLSWVSLEAWHCLQYVANTYLNKDSLYFYLDDDSPPNQLWPSAPVFVSSKLEFRASFETDVIMVVRNIPDENLRGIRNRVVMVTESIQSGELLWTLYKILNVIIVIPFHDHCDVYSWSPYIESGFEVKRLNTWRSGRFLMDVNLYPEKVPNSFHRVSIKVLSIYLPPFSHRGSQDGSDDKLLDAIAKSVNLDIEWVHLSDGEIPFLNFAPNGSLSGFLRLCRDRSIDLAYGGLLLSLERSQYAEPLPKYFEGDLAWVLAAPKPLSITSGIYCGFSANIWCLILITFVIFNITLSVISKIQLSVSESFLTTLTIAIGQPFHLVNHSNMPRILFSMFFIYSQHICWFYQSTLLLNLFHVRYESEIRTLDDALNAGYGFIVQRHLRHLIPREPTAMWKGIIDSKKLQIVENFSYSFIWKQKMLKLGSLSSDDYALRTILSDEPLSKHVRFIIEPNYKLYGVMYTPLGHPLVPTFGKKISQVIESGLYTLWYRHSKLYSRKTYETLHIRRSLKLKNLLLAFYMLALFLIVAFGIFIVEVLVNCYKINKA